MDYIRAARPTGAKRGCLFCRLLRSKDDTADLVLMRGALGFIVMNRFPYNNGHLMVAPNRHVAAPEKLTDKESLALARLVQTALAALGEECSPQGFNVGMNLGRVAGAGEAGHLHIHIVPRWNGDTNFMPLLAETKVVSEHLATTYQKLKRKLKPKRICLK